MYPSHHPKKNLAQNLHSNSCHLHLPLQGLEVPESHADVKYIDTMGIELKLGKGNKDGKSGFQPIAPRLTNV